MQVKDIMTKKVITLSPHETLKEATLKLSKHDISGAPVIDEEGRVLGVVSEVDIIRTFEKYNKELKMVHLSPALSMVGLSFKEMPSKKGTEEIFHDVSNIEVQEMMKRNVQTVGPEDPVKVVIDLMASGKVYRVPVVSEGKLAGIVTRGDVIKGFSKIED